MYSHYVGIHEIQRDCLDLDCVFQLQSVLTGSSESKDLNLIYCKP